MKKKITLVLIALITLSQTGFSQDKLSANVGLGLGFPFTDLTENTYLGYKPNLGVTAGLGYQLGSYFRLRGDILATYFNGNNASSYYQANIYEGALAIEFNVARLFLKETNFKFNILAGAGMGLMTSNRFDINTRRRIAEVPANNNRTYSFNAQGLGGVNIGIPLTKTLDLNVGYTHRFVFDQPYIDGFASGDHTDSYGIANLGFTFFLSDPKDPSKIEVDPNRYKDLQMKADSLDRVADKAENTKEKIGRLEMSNQEKEVQIAMLQNQMDSLKQANDSLAKAKVVTRTIREGGSGEKGQTSDEKGSSVSKLGNVMFRVVIGSLPTKAQAERYMKRSNLDDSEMMVAYIEELNTYRVVYKSSSSYEQARKYLLQAKKQYGDAWIVEF